MHLEHKFGNVTIKTYSYDGKIVNYVHAVTVQGSRTSRISHPRDEASAVIIHWRAVRKYAMRAYLNNVAADLKI